MNNFNLFKMLLFQEEKVLIKAAVKVPMNCDTASVQ